MVKRVRDPIHNYIPLDAPLLEVVDTPKFQRLRRVRQLGTAHLVYPGAQHTRFEHSLGASHLAGLAARALDLPDERGRELRLAALLHDVGHGPFSHLTDYVMMDYLGKGHVDVSREAVQKGVLADILHRHGVDPAAVADLIGGAGPLGALISGGLDVDRMDYLVRDSHYTGVTIGVDLERIVTHLTLTPEGLAIREDALPAAEALLVTRFQMYATVYLHHTCRAAEVMVDRSLRLALDAGEIRAADLPNMDDIALAYLLRHSKTPAWRLMMGVDQRRLHKVALESSLEELGEARARDLSENRDARGELETGIAEAAGADPVDVAVDAPPLPASRATGAHVLTESGDVRPIHEVSPVVASLHQAERAKWRLRVLAPGKLRESVLSAAREHL